MDSFSSLAETCAESNAVFFGIVIFSMLVLWTAQTSVRPFVVGRYVVDLMLQSIYQSFPVTQMGDPLSETSCT